MLSKQKFSVDVSFHDHRETIAPNQSPKRRNRGRLSIEFYLFHISVK